MRKTVITVLGLSLALSLAGCAKGGDAQETTAAAESTAAETTAAETTAAMI